MKEHFQDFGVRKWAGDDLIELQAEPLAALQGLVAPYAPCILQGCEMEAVSDGSGGTPYRLHAGLAALKGVDVAGNACVKIVRVEEKSWATDTVYLSLKCEQKSRTYADGNNKVIANEYKAALSATQSDGALKISATAGAPRLVDTLGITQKLNTVGGNAKDVVVTFMETGNQDEPEDLKSGLTLGLLISRIKKWLGKKVDKKDGYGLSKNDFTDGLKTKLEGFTHQAGGDLTGNYPNPTICDSVALTGSPSVQGNLYIMGNIDEGTGNLYLQNEDGTCGQIEFGCGESSITQSDDGNLLIHSNNNIVLEGMTVVDGSIKDYYGNEFVTQQYVDTNKYTHPTHTPHSSGLYKITVDESGHVSDATAVKKQRQADARPASVKR